MKKFLSIMLISSIFLVAGLFADAHKISRFPTPSFEELPKDIQATYKAMEKKFGFVPNFVKGMAHRPDELRAYLAYAKAVMQKKSGLSAAEKQMLIIAHSAYNGCIYCVASHSASLRSITKNTILADQISVNYKEADISERERAIIDFAIKVTNDSKSIDENDYKTLNKHGLSNEDIWDIAAITAFFNMSNRMMSFAAIRADDEFFKMGR